MRNSSPCVRRLLLALSCIVFFFLVHIMIQDPLANNHDLNKFNTLGDYARAVFRQGHCSNPIAPLSAQLAKNLASDNSVTATTILRTATLEDSHDNLFSISHVADEPVDSVFNKTISEYIGYYPGVESCKRSLDVREKHHARVRQGKRVRLRLKLLSISSYMKCLLGQSSILANLCSTVC